MLLFRLFGIRFLCSVSRVIVVFMMLVVFSVCLVNFLVELVCVCGLKLWLISVVFILLFFWFVVLCRLM